MVFVKIEHEVGGGGHYKISKVNELKSTEIKIADLTRGSAKNQFGVHNFDTIELIDDDNNKPLEFYVYIEDKKYRFVPKKTKAAAQSVYTTAELLGIQAYPIAMNNYIEKRKNELFVTRKMTYYTIILVGEPVEEKEEELMYVHVLMYIFDIPNNSELESTRLGVVPKNFGGGECVLSLQKPIPTEKIKNIPNIHKLSPQNYINWCEVMTLLDLEN